MSGTVLRHEADAARIPVASRRTVVLANGTLTEYSGETYTAAFPTDPAAFRTDDDAASTNDEQCFLVFFHIQAAYVGAFQQLMLAECESVLVNESGMLRYDLFQSDVDPCRFVVLELLADAAAMAAHEARRADGTMRAAIASMEAVSRKQLAGTGLYSGAARLRWPAEWRERTMLRALCTTFLQPPPSFIASYMPTKILHAAVHSTIARRPREWLSRVLGQPIASADDDESANKLGGLSGHFRFLIADVGGEAVTLALKQTAPANLERSFALGNAREGLFYRHLAPHLSDACVPHAYTAGGNMQSGESLVLMERIDGVPAGLYFGRGNPNNWAVGELPAADGPSAEELSAAAFTLYARMHGAHWRDLEALCAMPWLRGAEWAAGQSEESWQRAMAMAADAWAALTAQRRDGTSKIEWDNHLVACVDASFAKASWAAFLAEQRTRPLTLVHGDAHPHNALFVAGGVDAPLRLRLIDFEMIGVGSGAQELGQFLISHLEPSRRRAAERGLVAAYHAELTATLRARGRATDADEYPLESCWAEYVAGGAGRWAWFVPYLAHNMPSIGQYFHDQLAAFLRDHVSEPSEAPMPRV